MRDYFSKTKIDKNLWSRKLPSQSGLTLPHLQVCSALSRAVYERDTTGVDFPFCWPNVRQVCLFINTPPDYGFWADQHTIAGKRSPCSWSKKWGTQLWERPGAGGEGQEDLKTAGHSKNNSNYKTQSQFRIPGWRVCDSSAKFTRCDL